jgi:site-specific DNA recombinase
LAFDYPDFENGVNLAQSPVAESGWCFVDTGEYAIADTNLVDGETSCSSNRQLAYTLDCIRDAERRVTEIDVELATLAGELVDEAEVAAALADSAALWDCLAPREQSRVIELLVERVEYDGDGGSVSITFRQSGIKSLAGELAERKEEAA